MSQTQKDLILEWASALEEKYNAYGQQDQIYQICSLITRNLQIRSASISLTRWVQKVLPDKYKMNSELYASRHANNDADLPVEFSIYKDEIIDHLIALQQADLKKLGIKGNQQFFDYSEMITKRSKEYCDNHLIAILPDDGDHGFGAIPDRYSETIRIQKPKSLETGLSSSIQDVIDESKATIEEGSHFVKVLEGWKAKVISYPPAYYNNEGKWVEDKDFVHSCEQGMLEMSAIIRELRDGIRIAALFFAPTLDDKWRRTWLGWAEIIRKRYDHGKHGASSLTGDVDADGNRRKITREQIGDKTPIAIKFFEQAVEKIQMIKDNHRWYKSFKQMYTSKLSNDLHDKLSERS